MNAAAPLTGRSAEVTPADLPVKEAAAFMELYARTHPDASYEPDGPALVAAGERDTYAATVLARLEEGGPKRGIGVDVEGTAYAESEHVRTHVAEEVTFEEVPRGEYTVRADPD